MDTVTDRSKSRVRQTAEVFTCDELADRLVSQMDVTLFTDPTKKILEPSAGNGQLVLAILRRMKSLGRTDWEHILQQQLYICEYMKDNVEEMLDRLTAYTNLNVRLLNHNIVWADFLKFVNNKITYEDWNDNRYTNLQYDRIINIMTPNEKMIAVLSEG